MAIEFSLEEYKAAIETEFPEFSVSSISFLGRGWANQVCLVNESIVFRFPLDAASEQQLIREIHLLPILAPELTLPIPEFSYVALNFNLYPFSFVGYELIPGELISQPDDILRQAVWWRSQAASFLMSLHRIPISKCVSAGLQGYQTALAWKDALMEKQVSYQEHVLPLLSISLSTKIASLLKKTIQDERMVSFTPVVLHQDFDFHNFLVDLEKQQITGVIDFGSITIGDPAVDVSEAIRPYYQGVIDIGWDFRRDYYHRTSALEDLLFLITCQHDIPDKKRIVQKKLAEIVRIWS